MPISIVNILEAAPPFDFSGTPAPTTHAPSPEYPTATNVFVPRFGEIELPRGMVPVGGGRPVTVERFDYDTAIAEENAAKSRRRTLEILALLEL